jgi:Cu/Ag efflux pump CusA
VRLGDVASVNVKRNPAVIQRDAVSRRIDVLASVSGRSRDDAVTDVKHALAGVGFPLEYHWEILDDTGQPIGQLVALGITALIGTILLLQAFLGSWRRAALLTVAMPVAVSGAVLGILADGGTMSIGSVFGILAVLAVAIRGGLMTFERLGGESAVDAVASRAGDRLLPTVTGASAIAVAFLPVAILGDRAGLEVVHPMAIAILGGLITSTAAGLFLLPVLHAKFVPAGAPAGERRRLFTGWAGFPDALKGRSAASEGTGAPESGTEVPEPAVSIQADGAQIVGMD